MKILIWYWGRKGGGAKYSEEIAKNFIMLDRENTYLSFSKQSDVFSNIKLITDNSFHINTYKNGFEFLVKSLILPLIIFKFIYFIKVNKITHVYTTMPHIWTIAFVPFFKIFNIKHIVTIHDASPHPGDNKAWKWIIKYLVKNASKVVVLSNYVKSELIKHYKINNKNIILSKHGILHYNRLDNNIKNFYDGKLRLIFFGRIKPYKGLGFLLKAQIELEKKFDDIYLEIYGSGNLKPYMALINKIKNIKLENRWIKDDEIYDIFNKPGVNIATYIEASQSGTIPIALSCGIPSIVTDVGGLSEQIVDQKTGFIIKRGDIIFNLVKIIEKVYYNRSLLTEMSKNAIKYVENELNWKNICLYLKNKIEV